MGKGIKMINVAVLGYGAVGSGTVSLIFANKEEIKKRVGEEVTVKKILDIRDFSDSPYASLFTNNIDDIINDPEISVVAEVIGGVGAAYKFTVAAFKAGKSVVTSNKEIVATHGLELIEEAKKNGVSYLFEASVGGGIPVLRPLYDDIAAANKIDRVDGIVNGTTNYILTSMKEDGKDFATALKEAQEKRYAEANPAADIEGKDTARKTCILGGLSFGKLLPVADLYTVGITNVRLDDLYNAEAAGGAIKLIGSAIEKDGKIYEAVRPCFLPFSNPLSRINDVFNGVKVSGNYVGDVMFYGRGAGSEPTASAVVSDIVAIAKAEKPPRMEFSPADADTIGDIKEYPASFFLSFANEDKEKALSFFPQKGEIFNRENEIFFITEPITRNELKELIKKAEGEGASLLSFYEVL